MDGFTEKKWFVYIGDHHEGPFSLEEVQEKMTQGAVTSENYVWKEGMGDWKMMPEVLDFNSIIKTPPKPITAQPISSETLYQLSSPAPPVEASPTAAATPAERRTREIKKAEDLLPAEPDPTKRKKIIRYAKTLAPLAILAGIGYAANQGLFTPLTEATATFGRPYLVQLSEKVPALDKWMSPIPPLEDVSSDEYENLKTAAKGNLEKDGARLAIALSKADHLAPAFYIASNLPDDSQFHVYVVGISDTLLNQLSFMGQVDVAQAKHIGKSGAVRFADGRPIPRGEYVVYVSPSETQPVITKAIFDRIQASPYKPPAELPKDTKILIFKTYFLGGPRDTTYATRLKEFHDKLRERAENETKEIEQFASTLETQLNSTATKFAMLRKGKMSSKQRKTWESFHIDWMKLESQLNQIFQKWTPETIHKDYFYESLYQFTQQLGIAVEKVHELHHAYFTGVGDPKTFEIQLGETLSSAQSAVTVIKAKIEQAKKLSPTPNGMPRREGL
jgi:hypothetical protein